MQRGGEHISEVANCKLEERERISEVARCKVEESASVRGPTAKWPTAEWRREYQ